MRETFRRGDLVEVRSASEILATLDDTGSSGGLPFMPEMVQYCGKRFIVDKMAEKVCDTIKTYGSRRMQDTVLLADLRCNGFGHDNCQAECRLFWRNSWIRRIALGDSLSPKSVIEKDVRELTDLTIINSKKNMEVEGQIVEGYRCQATELFNASTSLSVWDPRPYIRQFTSGNVSFGHFIRVSARAFIEEPLRKFRLIPDIALPGTRTGPAPDGNLGLQPGEWVQVKTREEIAVTLTPEGRERGLWFDREMIPFCGKTFQVRQVVKRFIDDRSCQMLELKSVCVTLNRAVCSGDLSIHRHFCPREIFPYWRESWLRRINVKENYSNGENIE